MNRPKIPAGLYAIADSQFGDPFEQALRLGEAGCAIVQIRAKDWSCDEIMLHGQRSVTTLRRKGVVVIINDHIRAAKALNASGVHLGQEDGSTQTARAQLGPQGIIGLSTHSISQAAAAATTEADYIGFGPIFSTRTKTNPGPLVGLKTLAEAVRTTPLPVIAIGGINVQHVIDIRSTGAHGWAVASALTRNGTLLDRVQAFS